MTESPRDYAEALDWALAQANHPSQDWTNYCQKFVRSCYDIPALFGSAWAQWEGADPEDRHPGTNPDDAPLGAALCFQGGTYGHIDLAARPFPTGRSGAWSNDLVVIGRIDKVGRNAPEAAWGHRYVGYLTAVNDYDLQLKEKKPPKPKQDKQYKSIAKAIDRMERGLETAQKNDELNDVARFQEEIKRLRRMYRRLRHA